MACDCDTEVVETISSDSVVYRNLAISLVVLFVLGYVFYRLQLTRYLPSLSGGEIGASMALIFGITAGLSTCMALVGGMVVAISAKYAEAHPGAKELDRLKPQFSFNLGRIAGFTLLGALMGYLGSFLRFSSFGFGLLLILSSVAMLFIGLQLTALFPKISKFTITLPSFMTKFLDKHDEFGPFFLGIMTFFLPCGFTQAVQLSAIASGSLYTGAIIMGAFALGTTPGLFLAGAVSANIKGRWSAMAFAFVGVLVVLLSLFNIRNGVNLLSLQRINVKPVPRQVQMADGVQVIKMEVTSTGYSPSSFVVKKGVPVRWEINVIDTGTCAAFLVAPNITEHTNLKRGTNIVEFTPKEAGELKFSCSMGMYTGVFVVE